MRQGVGRDPVAPDDGRGRDQRVDDRLLGRLDGRVEQPVDDDVADGPDVVGAAADRVVIVDASGRQPIAGREGDEQVAARVPAGAADAGDAETGPLGQPLALVGEERRVGRDDDDDRARARRRRSAAAPTWSYGLGTSRRRDRLADPHAIDPQPVALAVVGLDEDADRVAADVAASMTRDAVPMPPLNSWQTIPVPPPTAPSVDRTVRRRRERRVQVLGPDVEAVDVVEQRRRTSRRRPAATT